MKQHKNKMNDDDWKRRSIINTATRRKRSTKKKLKIL